MASGKVTIKIPRVLYEKIRKVTEGSGFNSPTDFIVYVLRDLLGEREAGHAQAEFTEEEVEVIRRRLRGLGYL